TIHDSNGLLISHGTTGYDGKHIFSALKPGEYTVNTSFYRQVQSESVSVAVDSPVSLDFQFGLPEEVLIDKVEINTAESFYEKSYNLEAGYYSIYTEENTEPFADTVLYLYDSNGNLIAGNNDYNDLYSRIDMYLESGEYVVYVEEYNGSPLNCMLYVTKTEF
ncbi:MAG: carboxypeptidase-like regulatory domain-containing protein, partial [bacterium]